MKNDIRTAWRDRRTLVTAVWTVAGLVVVLILFSRFLVWVEQRSGVVLDDPLLALFAPRDVSWFTFGIIYVSILSWIGIHVSSPRYLMIGLQSYALLVVVRMGAMWLTPLDPPADTLPLIDRMVESLGPGQQLSKDLFFSGHTSTLFLLALAGKSAPLRRIYYVLAAAVAVCVVLQHAHYAIDVYVAPFMSFAVWSFVKRYRGVGAMPLRAETSPTR